MLAFAASAVTVAIAALAVAERSRLEPLAISQSLRIRPLRVAGRALLLWLGSSAAFALLESYSHWRAGLGWHGLNCLLGPVHRDAVPFLAALSLVASAIVAAAGHVLGWLRRVVRRLAGQVPAVWPSVLARLSAARRRPGAAWNGAWHGARAPPRLLLVRPAASLAGMSRPTRRTHAMTVSRKSRLLVLALGSAAALAAAGSAWAHAEVSPPVTETKVAAVFTLAVPTEKENATTTKIEFTPPSGFSIDSFAPSPGWTRDVQQTGSGEEAVIQKVVWSGGKVPTGEDAFFQFLATPDSSKTYTFQVRQTYSDGSVVDWTGPESSDTPAPTIEAKSSLGGGGSSTLAIVALVVGALGLVVALVALFAGRRSLA